MVYTVIAEPEATDQLAEIWMNSPDRQAVERASNHIDALLRIDPLSQGIAADDERIVYEPPLAVVYRVNAADRLVSIKLMVDKGPSPGSSPMSVPTVQPRAQ